MHVSSLDRKTSFIDRNRIKKSSGTAVRKISAPTGPAEPIVEEPTSADADDEPVKEVSHIAAVAAVAAGAAAGSAAIAAVGGRKSGVGQRPHRQEFYRPSALLDVMKRADAADEGPKWKSFIKLALPHIGLCLCCILYTIAGALLFFYLEKPHEQAKRREAAAEIQAAKKQLLDDLWLELNRKGITYEEWKDLGEEQMEGITDLLYSWHRRHYSIFGASVDARDENMDVWTMVTAVFFATTTITTTGYGNLVPITQTGRILTVLYGLFGIPLMVVTIGDIGKFLGMGVVWVHKKYCKLGKAFRQLLGRRKSDSEIEEELDPDAPQPIEDEVPASWLLMIVFLYTSFGGVLQLNWEEHWGFFNSFYFSFITMSTVGFGDLVPSKQMSYMVTLCYLLLGLAITSMCIDQIGGQYIQKVHYVGRKFRSARAALRNVGDFSKYAHLLKRRYGLGTDELRKRLLAADLAFIPNDINRIYFIDQRTDTSASEDMAQSTVTQLKTVEEEDENSISSF